MKPNTSTVLCLMKPNTSTILWLIKSTSISTGSCRATELNRCQSPKSMSPILDTRIFILCSVYVCHAQATLPGFWNGLNLRSLVRPPLSTDVDRRTDNIKSNPIGNTSPFLRLQTGTIQNRTRGRSTHPIRNTFPFLGLDVSNLEHFLAFKAPCGDNPRVQSGTPLLF